MEINWPFLAKKWAYLKTPKQKFCYLIGGYFKFFNCGQWNARIIFIHLRPSESTENFSSTFWCFASSQLSPSCQCITNRTFHSVYIVIPMVLTISKFAESKPVNTNMPCSHISFSIQNSEQKYFAHSLNIELLGKNW